MNEPRWLIREAIIAVHNSLLSEHGGLPGVRDENMLGSALNRPINKFAYEDDATLYECAAAYAFGLARNHPFADGNKQTAFSSIAMVLGINGHRFHPDKKDALLTILKLAAGELEEDELSRWIEANTSRREAPG